MMNSEVGHTITPVQKAAGAVGAVFLLAGIGGFIPGVTTHYGEMTFAGERSGALLVNWFQVSILHNIVHLAFGVAGLVLARAATTAKGFLIGGGAIYGVVWIYGMFVDDKLNGSNFIPVNSPDNTLHFFLAAGMLVLGLTLGSGRRVASPRSEAAAPRPSDDARVSNPDSSGTTSYDFPPETTPPPL